MKRTTVAALIVAALGVMALSGCDAFTSVDSRIERAEKSLEQGDYDTAVAEIKKALEKEPENAQARLILAEASLKLGDPVAAETELQRAAGGDPATAQKLKVDSLLLQGKPDEAAAVLKESPVVTGPDRDVRAGRILLAQDDPQGAEVEFDAAAAAGSLEGRLGKVDALVGQGRIEEAQAVLERILAGTPDSGAAWLALGSLQARGGRFVDAAASYAKAIENGGALTMPQRVQAHAARIESLLNVGDLDGAGRAQADLQKVAGGAPVTLITGARLALARGEAKAAVEQLQRVVQAIPRQPELRALLVTALLAEGSLEQALAEAGKAVADFPESEAARLTLAQSQIRAGRQDEAAETLRPLIDRNPPSPRALTLAAQIEMQQGRGASGAEYLERGIEANPDDMRLRIELAAAYVASGRAPEAVELLRDIPDGAYATQRDRLLVIAVAATRDTRAARAEVERALKAHPEDVALLNLAASYYTATGDVAEARKVLQAALELQPGDARSQLSMARLDARSGDLEAAAAAVQSVLKADPGDSAALGLMVEIAQRQGKPDEVERWLEEARRADPATVLPRVQLAGIAASRNQVERVDALVAELDRVAADRAPVQSAIGALMAQANRAPQAKQRFARAIELDPQLPEPHVGLGRLYGAEGKVAEARAELRRALELRPGWIEAASPLAMLEIGSGNVDEALRVASAAKQRSGDAAAGWILEGDVRFSARQPAKAADAYAAALEREPSATTAVKAVAARRAAGMANAERPLADYVEQHPADLRARAALANIYLSAGRFDDSIREYERVVLQRPDDAVSLNNLAWLYTQKKDPRAMETGARAYQLSQESAAIGDTYGWILMQNGQGEKALPILAAAAEKAPKNMEIQYHYAFALNAVGRADEARRVLKAALSEAGRGAARADAEALLKDLGG